MIGLAAQAFNGQERAPSVGEKHESVDLGARAFMQNADLLDLLHDAALLEEGAEPAYGSPIEVDIPNVDLALGAALALLIIIGDCLPFWDPAPAPPRFVDFLPPWGPAPAPPRFGVFLPRWAPAPALAWHVPRWAEHVILSCYDMFTKIFWVA